MRGRTEQVLNKDLGIVAPRDVVHAATRAATLPFAVDLRKWMRQDEQGQVRMTESETFKFLPVLGS